MLHSHGRKRAVAKGYAVWLHPTRHDGILMITLRYPSPGTDGGLVAIVKSIKAE